MLKKQEKTILGINRLKPMGFGLIFLLAVLPAYISAQNNTFYFMDRVPQSMMMNPAIQPVCKVYVGIPMISGIVFGLNHHGPSMHDVLKRGTGTNGDSLTIDWDGLDSKLKDKNYLALNEDITILSFGFSLAKRKSYFSLSLNNKTSFKFGYPGGLLALRNGNYDPVTNQGIPINLGGLGVDFMNYNQLSLCYSQDINKKVTVGFRFKFLKGVASLITKKSDLTVNTRFREDGLVDAIIISPDYQVFTSPLKSDIYYNPEGVPDSISFQKFTKNIDIEQFAWNKNTGYGIDLGASWQITKRLNLSASLIDLGYIKWKTNPTTANLNGTYEFKGIEIKFDKNGTALGMDSILKLLKDSVLSDIRLTSNHDPFTTYLDTRLYAGLTFEPLKWIYIGLLGSAGQYNGKIDPMLNVSAGLKFFKAWMFCASYSMMSRSYNNLGIGWSFKAGPLNWYFTSDNIPVTYSRIKDKGIVIPDRLKTLSFRTGFNFMFGCRKAK